MTSPLLGDEAAACLLACLPPPPPLRSACRRVLLLDAAAAAIKRRYETKRVRTTPTPLFGCLSLDMPPKRNRDAAAAPASPKAIRGGGGGAHSAVTPTASTSRKALMPSRVPQELTADLVSGHELRPFWIITRVRARCSPNRPSGLFTQLSAGAERRQRCSRNRDLL